MGYARFNLFKNALDDGAGYFWGPTIMMMIFSI